MDKKYVVDEIIDDKVKLEDCNTKEMVTISKKVLPSNIFDGAILIKKNNSYYLDQKASEERKSSIRSRMDKLKKNG